MKTRHTLIKRCLVQQVRAEHNSEHALLLKGGHPLFEEEEEDQA
jgi:hypothetical protein